MITDMSRYILSYCPECSAVTTQSINAFKISRDKPYIINCSNTSCSNTLIKIIYRKNKYEIYIDCPICGEEHLFTISAKTLFEKDFFILNCPVSGFGILFAGKDKNRIESEYYAQNELIAGIIADNDEDFSNLDILFDIIKILNDFALSDAISCKCGSNKIDINVDNDSVRLVCKVCKNEIEIPATEEALDELESSDSFILD